MATAEVAIACGSWTRSASGSSTTQPSTSSTLWDDLDIEVRLNLIARAWQLSQKNAVCHPTRPTSSHGARTQTAGAKVIHRLNWEILVEVNYISPETNVALLEQNHPSPPLRQHAIFKPLIVPNASPKQSRLSAQCEPPKAIDDTLRDPSRTGHAACQRAPAPEENAPAPSDPETTSRRSREDSIFRDPSMDVHIDFSSEEGFSQFAKKKKKAPAPAAFNWGDELNKGDGTAGDDGNGGDQNGGGGGGDAAGSGNGGDAGGGGSGGGDDDKDKDKDKKDDPAPEDPWGAFEAAGTKKKKGKKGAEPEPVPEPVPTTFDDIKLDDPPPDEGKKETKTGVFASWGSSWLTGGSGTKASDPLRK
ncbi:hypothetical protein PG988_008317 [Apiospora saccharicola]